jgi:hypothetical protein
MKPFRPATMPAATAYGLPFNGALTVAIALQMIRPRIQPACFKAKSSFEG